MPKPNLSRRLLFGILILAVVAAGIPLALSQTQVQQILTGRAWSSTQSASAICGPTGTAIINVRFTNQEASRKMLVKAVDVQSGKSVDLGTVAGGGTGIGEINTLKTSLTASQVTFNLAWADAPATKDVRSAPYTAVSTCIAPTPTRTPTPRPTNTPTPKPSNAPTPTATKTPTPTATKTPTPTNPASSATPTTCPTPGTVKNVKIQCPYCTPSPSQN